MEKFWFIFNKDKILLQTSATGFSIPLALVCPFATTEHFHVFHLENISNHESVALSSHGDSGKFESESPEYKWVDLRESYSLLPLEFYLHAGKARELTYWDETHSFCTKCASRLQFSTEISKKCPTCGTEYWPELSIAVIVLISHDNKALLVKARNFKRNFYGLVAGFVETGETLEHAVEREVMEETGIKIKNLRYRRSQPWPYPSGIMVGFFADYDSGTVEIDSNELVDAQWFTKDNLPTLPEHLSIARMLIEEWKNQ